MDIGYKELDLLELKIMDANHWNDLYRKKL
jgi:hypothetical protein